MKHIPACILNACWSLFICANRQRKPSAEVRSTSFYSRGLENSAQKIVDVTVNLFSMGVFQTEWNLLLYSKPAEGSKSENS